MELRQYNEPIKEKQKNPDMYKGTTYLKTR